MCRKRVQSDFFGSIGQSRKCSCLHGTSVVPSRAQRLALMLVALAVTAIGIIRIDGKGYLGHRLASLYMHGHFPDGLLDHKIRNPSSCRIADLRKATQPKRRKYKLA